jgi:hypothetical protein
VGNSSVEILLGRRPIGAMSFFFNDPRKGENTRQLKLPRCRQAQVDWGRSPAGKPPGVSAEVSRAGASPAKGWPDPSREAGLTAGGLTPALKWISALSGAAAYSFDNGAKLLEERAGVWLSESTVEWTTADAGQRRVVAVAAGSALGPEGGLASPAGPGRGGRRGNQIY